MIRIVRAMILMILWASVGVAGDFPIGDGKRLVFLGDSITKDGTYVRYVDAYLMTRFPDRKIEVINLGLSSETVSGTSEVDHPFPRPDVHERLGRALEMTKPDFVAACYGMNDGIYHPIDGDRFSRYRAGVHAARRSVEGERGDGVRRHAPAVRPEPDPVEAQAGGFERLRLQEPVRRL